MKPGQLAIAIGCFLAAGGAAFVVVRSLDGGAGGGAATREGLVAATVAGVNAGDRDALLELMVGPASDRVATTCDNDQEAAARDQHRAERVDDALGEARRRRLVLDHIGDDHAEVVLRKGNEVDKHCTARVDVVKHRMELLLHDAKNTQYKAQLVGMEIAGRWYLATIPLAEPIGGTPPAPVATVPVASPPAPEPAAPARPVVDGDGVPASCTSYMQALDRHAHCVALPEKTRNDYAQALQTFKESIANIKTYADVRPISASCQKSLEQLLDAKMGC